MLTFRDKLVKNVGLAVAAFGTYALISKVKQKSVEDDCLDHTPRLKNSGLAGIVVRLKRLGQDNLHCTLCIKLEEFLDLLEEDVQSGTSGFIANRSIKQAENIVHAMIVEAKRSANANFIDAAIYVETDDLPQLMGSCDTMLRNKLLMRVA